MSSAAIFLDRDGTIIVEKNYPSHPDQVALLEGAVAGLRAMARHAYPLVVVSNQSGIGRGYFSIEQADAVERRLIDLLLAKASRYRLVSMPARARRRVRMPQACARHGAFGCPRS